MAKKLSQALAGRLDESTLQVVVVHVTAKCILLYVEGEGGREREYVSLPQ